MATNAATSRLLTPPEAAEVLQVHPRTLSNWRSEGRGPRYAHAGRRVRYRQADLDQWLDRNTTDPGGPR